MLIVAPACGDGDSDAGLPDGAVARVGAETIDRSELLRELAAVRRSQRGRPAAARRSVGQPQGGGSGRPSARREQLEQQALATLLHRAWIAQQAEERGVSITYADARRYWRVAVGNQFATPRELRRFLGGQTETDAIRQLHTQLLADALMENVRAEAPADERDRAVERFREAMRSGWRDETVCRRGYVAPGCSPD